MQFESISSFYARRLAETIIQHDFNEIDLLHLAQTAIERAIREWISIQEGYEDARKKKRGKRKPKQNKKSR